MRNIVCGFIFLSIIILPSFVAGQSADDSMAALQTYERLSGSQQNMITSAMGIPSGGISIAKIMAYVIFSSIGFIAFMYGKKNEEWRPLVIGIVLMGYGYFLSNTVALYIVGCLLTAGLYFWRE